MSFCLRDDLLVTMGARAASMEDAGVINLPEGVEGETILAKFVANKVDHYMAMEDRDCFDLYIEEALEKEYGNGEQRFPLWGIVEKAICYMVCEEGISINKVCEYIGCNEIDLKYYNLID